MEIKVYESKYRNQVISLILYLQNYENKVDVSLEEQPDIQDIESSYLNAGGGFWIAVNEEDDVVGTLGLMNKHGVCGVLKKFFVMPEYRGKNFGISSALFERLMEHAKRCQLHQIVLDTPASCHRAHGFYRKMGFREILKDQLPVEYDYPDRNSLLFMLEL